MATFVVSATTATFGAVIRGSSQEAGDLERLTVGVSLTDAAAWATLQSLVTTKYHVHVPMSSTPRIDVVRGVGEGTLTVSGLQGSATHATAVLVALARNTFARGQRSVGTAQFLITGAWS